MSLETPVAASKAKTADLLFERIRLGIDDIVEPRLKAMTSFSTRKGGPNLKIQIDGAYRASALSFFSRGFG